MEDRKKVNYKVIGFFVFAVILLLWVIASFNSTEPRIVKVETQGLNEEHTPRPVTVIEFSGKVPDPKSLKVTTNPSFLFSAQASENTLTIFPLEDLYDGVEYMITLSREKDDESLVLVNHNFTPPEYTKRREFLRNLPAEYDGYSVVRTSERGIYVLIDAGQPLNKSDDALLLLAEHGITSSFYDIDVDRADLDQDIPAPPPGSDFH